MSESAQAVPAGYERDDATGKLRPVKGEALCFGFEDDFMAQKGEKVVSLQDGFKGFRRAKMQAAKAKRVQEKHEDELRKDPAQMQQLRELFLDRCKSYYNVPYHQKYHDESTPCKCGKEGCTLFQSPIFLDCCGLVRQVLRDLKQEFGFETGPWNQAYQFDTLPVRYDTWDQMKPGDLVFAEGKYVNEKLKPQKGDIVHVEVFLGGGPEGKSVCGARWNKGVIQEFESYEFAPKSWTLTRWHFCSIDTWLQGICRSFHPEREWIRQKWVPGKHSIFAEGEEDENAGPGEDDDDDDGASAEGRREAGGGRKRFYVSRGNQHDLVVDALERKGWERIPFDHKDDLSYALKWTEVRSDIDFVRFRERDQLVNHVPNASVLTTKDGLIKSLRAIDRAAAQRARQQRGAAGERGLGSMNMAEFVPKTFLLNSGGDKLALLADLQEQLQAQEAGEPGAKIWIVKPVAGNQGHGILVTRDAAMLLNDYLGWRKRQALQRGAHSQPRGPVPMAQEGTASATAVMRAGDHEEGARTPVKRCAAAQLSLDEGMLDRSPGALYPTNRALAAGGPRHLLGHLSATNPPDAVTPEGSCLGAPPPPAAGEMFVKTAMEDRFVVQEYITRPLLLGRRKFDLRCYVLVVATKPHFVAVFRGGYVRLSLSEFSLEDVGDRFVHLTNAAVQKKHPEYKERGDEAIKSMRDLQLLLEEEGSVPAGWVDNTLTPQLQRIAQHVCSAAQAKFVRRRGQFELLGLDFMVDEDLTPWLIEVNSNPALWMHSATQRQLLPALVRDSLDLVLAYHCRLGETPDAAALRLSDVETYSADKFVILCDEAWGKDYQYPLPGPAETVAGHDVTHETARGHAAGAERGPVGGSKSSSASSDSDLDKENIVNA